MRRVLSVLTLAAFAGVAVADVPPPPPPKGKKYVSVNNEVLLGKGVTGYVFVKQVTNFPPRGKPLSSKLELSTTKPTPIPEPARRTSATLYAIPEATAKEYKTDDELFDVLRTNKVKGAHHISFGSTAIVSDKVKGNSVKRTYTITAIDAKGIKTKVEGEGYEPPAANPRTKEGQQDSPDAEDTPTATAPTPRGGMLVAGIAATLAVMLGGLWIVGRTRRKA